MSRQEHRLKRRVFEIIQIGNRSDIPSCVFDIFITIAIIVNMIVLLLTTFTYFQPYLQILTNIEFVIAILFAIEYCLRLWTADDLYPAKPKWKARLRFVFSFYGLIDLMTILPFFLPFIFPHGAVAFRFFRVIRIFRLFAINATYDAFNVIIDVIKVKKGQILSSVVLVVILMLSSALCMYSIEHEVQPENFQNVFSGIWWSVSTLLTVGYGDIYPITTLGRCMAILISFLGVGMVAIPTGIISAGFVEQYTKVKQGSTKNYLEETVIDTRHPWNGRSVGQLNADALDIVTEIIRGEERFVPGNEEVLQTGDHIIIYRVDR